MGVLILLIQFYSTGVSHIVVKTVNGTATYNVVKK